MLINNPPAQYSQNFIMPEYIQNINLLDENTPIVQNPFLNKGMDTFTKKEDKANVIAHRGYSSIAPENTIPAFIEAAKNGYKTIECDIEWTKDNIPVILHDKTINRTARKTNGWRLFWPKQCSRLNYKELLDSDFGLWFSNKYKGTKIPSLNETLECCKNYELNLYLELKETSNFDERKAQILADLVQKAELEDRVTWISFNEDYLKTMSNIMPKTRIGYLTKKEPSNNTIETLKSLQTGQNEVFLDIKASKITSESKELLKTAGFDFEAWTVNNTSALINLNSLNCKGITTDKISTKEAGEYFN